MNKIELNHCSDFLQNEDEQLETLIDDFKKGSRALKDIYGNISIFGSARFDQSNVYYQNALKISQILSYEGFNIISGGSGGIMEAANRGAYNSDKNQSIGINIKLPFEQIPNPYTTRLETLKNFSIRKTILIKNSLAFIVFPGGYGTLDELFEVAALVQTKKLLPVKIYLVGKEFWQPLLNFLQTSLVKEKTINEKDANLFEICDDLAQIVKEIKIHVTVYLEFLKNIGLENSPEYIYMKEKFNK